MDRNDNPEIEEAAPLGLRLALKEVAHGAQQESPKRSAYLDTSEPLSDEEAAEVLRRLEPQPEDADEVEEFAFPEHSPPPPKVGKDIETQFVDGDGPPAPAAEVGPLRILSHAPEGDVEMAPELTVVFSHPMASLTSAAAEDAEEPPVRLSPQPPGRWRWLDTRTLTFQPERAFPMATEYSVEIPSGIRSTDGATLPEPASWTFATPPLKLEGSYPRGKSNPTEPVIFIRFNQRIDRTALLPFVSTNAEKSGKEFALRPATDAEIDADAQVKLRIDSARLDTWLALRPTRPLPCDKSIVIRVSPGAPSAEGPRITAEPIQWKFKTHWKFQISNAEVGWCQGESHPGDPIRITLSNRIAEETLDDSQVQIEPEIPDRRIEGSDNCIYIEGATQPETTYRVTLPDSLHDKYGQPLEGNRTVKLHVGRARRSLQPIGQDHVVADPFGEPVFSIHSVNYSQLLVRLYKVSPEDWPRFAGRRARREREGFGKLCGERVVATTLDVGGSPNQPVETLIDLSPALQDGQGNVIVVVYPADKPDKNAHRDQICTWVQVTQLGLTASRDEQEAVVWVSALKDGRPRKATVSIANTDIEVDTDETGLAVLPLSKGKRGEGRVLIARAGNDVAFLPSTRQHGEKWRREPFPEELLWYVFNDRGIYRPGETARFKGWVRRRAGGKTTDVHLLDRPMLTRYEIHDLRGNKFAEGTFKLDPLKGFDLSVELPRGMNTGRMYLYMRVAGWDEVLRGRKHNAEFQVEEFRRPEYEVAMTVTDGPHFVRKCATATAKASYYAGGGLTGGKVSWAVGSRPADFHPPDHAGFSFGRWRPVGLWWYDRDDDYWSHEKIEGTTNAAGEHHVQLDFEAVNPSFASSVVIDAFVTDVNRQRWSASKTLLVHPSEIYVGLRPRRAFFQEDERIGTELVVCDLDGNRVTGRTVDVRLCRLTGRWHHGKWIEEESLCAQHAVTSGADPANVRFDPVAGGRYRLTAMVTDEQGRPSQTELMLWVAGGAVEPRRGLDMYRVDLLPSKRAYEAGDTAEVLVRSPFFPAEGTYTLRRPGIVQTERFSMQGSTHTLSIPISEDDYPNVTVQVGLVGATLRMDNNGRPDSSLPPQPAFADGQVDLVVPALRRMLQLNVTPQVPALEPGDETMLDIEVRDDAGQPAAGGELAVVVADEALLALSDYDLPDPYDIMYAHRTRIYWQLHLRQDIVMQRLVKKERGSGRVKLAKRQSGRQFQIGAFTGDCVENAMLADVGPSEERARPFGSKASAAGLQRIEVRRDFNPVALFLPSLELDETGRAKVPVRLPDSLTRYRVMVVAAWQENCFGKGEATLTARLPLMVRPSPPRFLNFGDQCELPVVVQNQNDVPVEARVVLDATNLQLTSGAGRRVSVPAGGRTEVRFPVTTIRPGTARLRSAAVASTGQDAASVEFPVWTPASTEATAVYGEIDEGAMRQKVDAPGDVFEQHGGLEITASATALAGLTDAVIYLVKYPFECSEQLASRIMGVATLRDVLAAFEARGMPKPQKMELAVRRDIEVLRQMQNSDGGFGFWRKGDKSWPFLSVYVPHVLCIAQGAGFEVPGELLEGSAKYLRWLRKHPATWYCREARWALEAYALYVLARMDEPDHEAAAELLERVSLPRLPLEAAGWLLTVFNRGGNSVTDSIVQHLENRATQTAATAHFTTAYADGAHLLLHSDRRADAVVLESLIEAQPDHPLVPKIVRGLLAHRTKGRWESTQENAFVLAALGRYFRTYESDSPDFIARCWLGSRLAAEHHFAGRTTDRSHLRVPMEILKKMPGGDVIVGKEGPGRLYYRIGMQYVPTSLRLASENRGFQVSRTYEPVDSPDDVQRLPDGTWRFRAGAAVRVRVELVVPTRRYHVALVDPLPAGLEAVNPALAVAPDAGPSQRPTRNEWWDRPWFDHQNLRDDRAEAFCSFLWEGSYRYEYVARATTPGRFIVPPPKAEEMYHPETFGRGETDIVVVE